MMVLALKFHTVSGEPIVIKNIRGYESFSSFMETNSSFKWITFNDVAVPIDKVVKIEVIE
ncbi:hypothetical protein BTI679_30930 [Bacillus wiedmannii]|nr:hypothetical protein [Bacillus wiedmannii]UOB95750.1 hypothetical protein BTI679_30930 [Bacillus wiedmannii]